MLQPPCVGALTSTPIAQSLRKIEPLNQRTQQMNHDDVALLYRGVLRWGDHYCVTALDQRATVTTVKPKT